MTQVPADLSPASWPQGEIERYFQLGDRAAYGHPRPQTEDHALAVGRNGAVVGTSEPAAVRSGLEALKAGGSAVDAALVTAMAQITLGLGCYISFSGILSMVHYEAATGEVTSLNAGYNTVRGETDPATIPGLANPLADPFGAIAPSGRATLVPGFMKGVEAAHRRFGKLPWATLFEPSIYFAENGVTLQKGVAGYLDLRKPVLSRRADTQAIFTKADGSWYGTGDVLRQPELAATLSTVAKQDVDYLYTGEWAERFVTAVQSEGGLLAMEDLAAYDVIWSDPVRQTYGPNELFTNGLPGFGGVSLIEALNLVEASGATAGGRDYHSDGAALAKVMEATKFMVFGMMPPVAAKMLLQSDAEPTAERRISKGAAAELWGKVQSGQLNVFSLLSGAATSAAANADPKHSAAVVSVDAQGNVCAMVHTINTVMWGMTGIFVDGVSINDSGSFQQGPIAMAGPGNRLPDPTEAEIVLRDGKVVLAGSSMGSGLHEKSVQCLVNILDLGMDPKQAVDAPAFLRNDILQPGGAATLVAEGDFDEEVLADARANGASITVIGTDKRTLAEGLWLGIQVEPSGELKAADWGYGGGRAEAF
jgi:gamma-glutamyltranspeptidase/glutathione hydrolase